VAVERTELHPGEIQLTLQNDGPDAVRIVQAIVNDGFASFTQDDGELGRLDRSQVTIAYPWIEGETYKISLLTSTGATVEKSIDVAAETPEADAGFYGLMGLIGLYVGIIPIAVGMLWLLVWLPFYDYPDKSKRVSPAELAHIRSDAADKGGERPVGWGVLLGYRQAWSFIVAKLLTDPVWWFFLTWLPDYFKKKWALDIKKSWVHLVTIYAIITVLSIIGGWGTGALARRGWSVTRARKTGMLISACCVLPIFFATSVGPWTAVLLIGIAGAAHQAWSANLFTTTSDMFPKRAVASLVGVGGMAGGLGGFAFPLLAGMLLDKMGTSGYATLFAICGSAYLVAFVLNHLLAPKFEPIEIPSRH